MSGFAQTIPTSFTDDSMERYYTDDDDLTKGHVLLWDCQHPESGITGGVIPANGAMLKNQAQEPARVLIPGATNEDLKFSVMNTLVIGGATPGAIAEKTAKGGLHIIPSKTNDLQNGNDYFMAVANRIRDYMLDNPTHEFQVRIFGRKTRISGTDTSADFYLMQNTANYKFSIQASGNIPDSVGAPENLLGAYNSVAPPNQLGAFLRVHTFKGFKGVIPADRSLIAFRLKWGSGGPYANFELNKAPSWILYRVEVLNLTVLQMSHATALQVAQAKYTLDFGPGGRFANDVFTDPALLA